MGSVEDGSERRHSEIELEKRLTRLEVSQDFILQQGKETHDVVQKMAELLTPLQEAIAVNTTDASWIKHWLWKVGIPSSAISGGLVAWAVEYLNKHSK